MVIDAQEFRRAAFREAGRYGSDRWVFLRELLQNSRDAGATRITITTRTLKDAESVEVDDNGRGMTWEHAQRYLFTLYASSKCEPRRMAGVFGVGFWSVLAFEPDEITVRSRAFEEAEGWEVSFGGRLEPVRASSGSFPRGTSVTLTRSRRGIDLAARVRDVVRRDAGHLRCRDRPEETLEVIVDGQRATEPLRAAAPGLTFSGPGMRGVVSLGKEPAVTVLAHGLRVRSAATVDDLLLGPGRGGSRATVSRAGLWPQVVVDSDRLTVLMARSDVAQDRELVRVARRVERETRRLYRCELDRLAPLSTVQRGLDLLRGAWRRRRGLGVGGALIAVAVMLVSGVPGKWSADNEGVSAPGSESAESIDVQPYEDRALSYSGPALDLVGRRPKVPELGYSPLEADPALAAFRVVGLDSAGRPILPEGEPRPAELADFLPGRPLTIEVVISSRGTAMRIPVPTGHAVDPVSLRLDGRRLELWSTVSGEPMIRPPGSGPGRLTYRTVPARMPVPAVSSWPELPSGLIERAAPLLQLAPAERVAAATDLVRDLLDTRLDIDTYETLRGARQRGEALFETAFRAGGGDCDVVNAVLAALLDSLGLPARLAVGWIGTGGRPLPGLHAWVEVDVGDGLWIAADASEAIAAQGLGDDPEKQRAGSPAGGGTVGATAAGTWTTDPLVIGSGVAVLLVGGGLFAAFQKRRFRRRLISGSDTDPGPVVESLMRDSAAWQEIPGIRHRRLAPLLGGGGCSLVELERAARRGRLFSAMQPSVLVDRVRAGGGLVLDGGARAGRAVASTLGALDLDSWRRSVAAVQPGDLGDRLGDVFQDSGVDVEIKEACGLAESVLSLRVPGDSRLHIVVDRQGTEWTVAADRLVDRPCEAVFRAADLLVRNLPDVGEGAARAVSDMAREAVLEAVGQSR